jgi:hypothetical protein
MLCADGKEGKHNSLFSSVHFTKRNTKFGGGKRERTKIPFPNSLPFRPPERSVSAARSAAINQSFAQKRFALRPVIATDLNITNLGLVFLIIQTFLRINNYSIS